MTITEIKTKIELETGLKTSLSKLTGSMKRCIRIRPKKQNGIRPRFSEAYIKTLELELNQSYRIKGYYSDYAIDVKLQ